MPAALPAVPAVTGAPVVAGAVTGVPFATGLAAHGRATALVSDGRRVSYAALARLVEQARLRLGRSRRLVLVAGAPRLETVVAYLGALAGGHPVLLAPGDRPESLAELAAAYDPDVVVGAAGTWEVRRDGTAHDLHPDLALLLSTSGSTGSPRLVRLSAANLQANAESIATYLGLRADDVAATTLPLHYCYGLSVLHSHLLRGATVVLTDLSVVDPCFWELAARHRVTSLAGVPHTFELLDRVGFAGRDLPSLRYLTQAGGRMAPATVRRYVELGQRRGFDLYVMYGQTEATARMAYLPPDLARERPDAVGVAVPGGSLRIAPTADVPADAPAGVGELVYDGPNVMLGYAERPADLALGRVTGPLHTGDLARIAPDGLVEIVGRRGRSAKVLGLRIDLAHLERVLEEADLPALCIDGQDRLLVGVPAGAGTGDRAEIVAELVRRRTGLPAGLVVVAELDEVPRLPSGKPDLAAVARQVTARAATEVAAPAPGAATDPVRSLYAELLAGGRDVDDADTFVGLGGDSLSYVEMSLRLEEVLGRLPAEWHLMPVGRLRGLAEPGPPAGGAVAARRPRWRTLETTVLLRAAAIVAIVGTHGNLFTLVGGAHVLLAVAGFNAGRFLLSGRDAADSSRRLVRAAYRVAVPSVLWIGGVTLLTGAYPWPTALLVNGLVGPRSWAEPAWHYWFIEALVSVLLALAVLVRLPPVHRAVRRWPFWTPVALAGLGLLTRYELVVLRGGDVVHRASVVFWLVALGWAASRASTTRHRVVVSVLLALTVPGFFDDPAREALVVLGGLVLVWVRQVRLPSYAARPVAVLGAASLSIYLTHWQVYPHLEDDHPWAAVLGSLLVGVLVWWLAERATAAVRGRLAASAQRAAQGSARRSAQRRAVSGGAVRASSPESSTGRAPGTTETVTGVPTG